MEKKLVRPLVLFFSFIPIVIGCVVLLGWLTHNESLIRIIPFFPQMRPISSIFFILSGFVLIIEGGMGRKIRLGLGVVLILHASSVFLGYEPYYHAPLSALTTSAFAILGLTFLFSLRKDLFSLVGAFIIFVFSGGTFLFYLFNADGRYDGMAMHSSVSFISVAVSLFFRSAVNYDFDGSVIYDWHPLIQTLRHFSVAKKFGLLLATLFVGLSVFGISTLCQLSRNNESWKNFNEHILPRSEVIRNMRALYGYGGGTYYFKNYILRGAEEYELLTKMAFSDLLKEVDKFQSLGALTKREYGSLESLRETASDYLYHVDTVKKLLREKRSPKEIDRMIWIEDDKALVAFENLDDEYHVKETAALEQLHRSRAFLVLTAFVGFIFAASLILVFAYLVNKTIIVTIASATQAAQDIVHERYDTQIAVGSRDELGMLSQALNSMRIYLKESRATIFKKTEDLSRAIGFLNSIFENLPTTVYLKDAASRKYTHFNRAGEALFGLKRDDVLDRTDFEILPQERAEIIRKSDEKVLKTRAMVEVPDETMELRTGTKILNTKKLPIVGSDGIPTHILGIAEDVTERRLLERTLKENQERLHLALKASQIASWDWRIQGDAITGDENFYSLMGITHRPSRISLANFSEFIHPEDRGKVTMGILDTVKNDRDLDLRFRVVRPVDRRERTFSWKAKLYKDHAGKIDLMAGIVTDVTERGNEKFAISDERFQHLYGHALNGVLLVDTNGAIHEANDAFLRMTGYGRREIVVLRWTDNLTPDNWWHQDLSKLKELSEKGWTDSYEKEIFRKNKTKLPVQVVMAKIDSRSTHAVIFFRSLSREKEIERQARLSKENLDFSNQEFDYVMNVVNEKVKIPVRALTLDAELIREQSGKKLPPEITGKIENLANAGAHVDVVLEALLGYFHVRGEKPKFTEIDSQELLADIISDLKNLIRDSSVSVSLASTPRIFGAVSAIQILFHLLIVNAIRRTPKGGSINIEGRQAVDGYEFIIRDTGVSLSGEFSSTFFTIADINKISDAELGLAYLTSKKILDLHSGKMWGENLKGGGVKISVSVPKYS